MVSASSFTWPTSGIMISACGSRPDLRSLMAALRIARVCIFTKSGIMQPEAAAAQPEHRVLLAQRLHGGQERAGPCELVGVVRRAAARPQRG